MFKTYFADVRGYRGSSDHGISPVRGRKLSDIEGKMNLETLLEAAKFVELQEVKQKKALQTFDARGKYPVSRQNRFCLVTVCVCVCVSVVVCMSCDSSV